MRIPESIEDMVNKKLPWVQKTFDEFEANPTKDGSIDYIADLKMIDINCGRAAYQFYAIHYDETCPIEFNLRYLTHL